MTDGGVSIDGAAPLSFNRNASLRSRIVGPLQLCFPHVPGSTLPTGSGYLAVHRIMVYIHHSRGLWVYHMYHRIGFSLS